MNRSEMIKSLSQKTTLTISQSDQTLSALEDILIDALIRDGELQWWGVLSAKVSKREAHQGRNPATNEVETFPETHTVKVKLSKRLKDNIVEAWEAML